MKKIMKIMVSSRAWHRNKETACRATTIVKKSTEAIDFLEEKHLGRKREYDEPRIQLLPGGMNGGRKKNKKAK